MFTRVYNFFRTQSPKYYQQAPKVSCYLDYQTQEREKL